MKHYFTHIPWTYVCSNSLYKAVLQLLQDNDRVILTQDELIPFKKGILERIDILNQLHSRCKPLHPHWEKENKKGDVKLYLGAGTICQYHIYATNND